MNEPQKKQNLFWTFLKTYWWAILMVLIAPVSLNFIILMPAFSSIVGTETDWLSFHGSYIGSVIASLITLYVLYKQLQHNHEENEKTRQENQTVNEKNRQLQLDILKYEQEKQWLQELKIACLDYIVSYNPNDLIEIGNIMCIDPDPVNIKEKIRIMVNSISRSELSIRIIHRPNSNYHDFKIQKCEAAKNFERILYEIQELTLLINIPSQELSDRLALCDFDNIKKRFEERFEEALPSTDAINKLIAKIIIDYFTPAEKAFLIIKQAAIEYLQKEENRINQILTE